MSRQTQPQYQRREFLKQSLAGAAALSAFPVWTSAAPSAKREKLPVAAVVSEYRVNSHADVILSKILEGWQQDGGPGPDLELVSLVTDQVPKRDISRAMAEKHGFRICETAEEALTLGGKKLAVAGVLSICEHGDYPYTEDTHQRMYPRRRFFDSIVEVFRKYDQVVPVFNDKHLAYNWADAKHMYDTAQEMKIPFMAGSSAPAAWRSPEVTLPMGSPIEQLYGVGYGGLESYGFHAFEGIQYIAERRQGAETGVRAVQSFTGEALQAAIAEGRWSDQLMQAAVDATELPAKKPEKIGPRSVYFDVEYRDGLKTTLAMNTDRAHQFATAASLKGKKKPFSVRFSLQEGKPYGHFAVLLQAIEHMIHTGKPAYPVERTLLSGGILDRVLHSWAQDGKRLETPELAIKYDPVDWPFAKGQPPVPREIP